MATRKSSGARSPRNPQEPPKVAAVDLSDLVPARGGRDGNGGINEDLLASIIEAARNGGKPGSGVPMDTKGSAASEAHRYKTAAAERHGVALRTRTFADPRNEGKWLWAVTLKGDGTISTS